jgi:hypothetical protein
MYYKFCIQNADKFWEIINNAETQFLKEPLYTKIFDNIQENPKIYAYFKRAALYYATHPLDEVQDCVMLTGLQKPIFRIYIIYLKTILY